jgi:hypothetical protein
MAIHDSTTTTATVADAPSSSSNVALQDDQHQPQEHALPLTASQILAHPEFPYVNWDLPPQRKERLVIGRGRGGPFKISFEIHGKGPIKTVVSN